MTPETIEWFNRKTREPLNLEKEEYEVISDFSLLWSFFEGEYLGRHCDFGRLSNFVARLERSGHLAEIHSTDYAKYLRDRYFNSDHFTHHHQYLNLGSAATENAVNTMLQQNDCTPYQQLLGCLVIIYRLRNNLFHGEKWLYNIHDQYSNFNNANNFLQHLMDNSPRWRNR